MENILNRIISIENSNGDTLMAIEIDEKGNIIKFDNCNIADLEGFYIPMYDNTFGTNKENIRLQIEND